MGKTCGSSACPVVFVYQVTDAPVLAAPIIDNQPGNVTVATGSGVIAQFGTIAHGTPWPTYLWQVSSNGGSTWTDEPVDPLNRPGSFNQTLYHAVLSTAENNYKFRAIVSNSQGSVITNTVTLTVTGTAVIAPSFSVQPNNISTTAGTKVHFTATIAGHPTPDLSVWWHSDDGTHWFDENAITGGGTSVVGLDVTALITYNNRLYRVCTSVAGWIPMTLTGTGTYCSNTATLTVH